MATYVIVGGSSGVGAALVQLLVADGHRVINVSRRHVDEATVSHMANVLTDTLPPADEPIHGVVYCPGSINLKPFRGLKADDFRNDFEINVLGATRVLQHYLPAMQQAGHASVVLFSTVAVSVGMQFHASVAAAKGAVEGLTRALAAEWAPKIRVNCIAPSLTDTPLAARLLDTDAKRTGAAERHPLRTVGEAKDVAALAAMLLSDQTKFVTGQVWHADGGMTAVR